MLDSGVPHEWFGLAFRECAANDVRTWAYARAIIVRWLSDGKVSDNRANGSGKRKRRDTTNSGNDIEENGRKPSEWVDGLHGFS